MSRIIKPVVAVILTSILLTLIVTFSLFVAGKLPYRAYLVHTPSMGHTIPSGSVVLVREHRYHVGQVITFVEGGTVITHRLVSINPNGTIITKGDANPTIDPWSANKSDIIGGVVRTSPVLGYVWVYLFLTWQGPASLALVLFGALMLWLISKELKKESRKMIAAQP